MDFAMAMHVLLLKNTKGIFPIEGFHLEVYLLIFTRQLYNKLPTQIKQVNTYKSFKKEVKKFLVHNAIYTIEEFYAL
jgi:hypothetical protein